jgi:hypothetical protein
LVSSSDAEWILQYVVGLRTFTPEQIEAADVDGPPDVLSTSTDVTAVDALMVQRYVSNLISTFNACPTLSGNLNVSFFCSSGSIKANLSWSPKTGASYYKAWYKTSTSNSWYGAPRTTGTTTTIPLYGSLLANTNYDFKVVWYDQNGIPRLWAERTSLNSGNPCTGSISTTTPSITVISPNGGEKWQLGDTHTILWAPYDPTSGINPVTQVTAYLEKLVNGNFVTVGKIVECGKASIHWDGDLNTCGSNNYAEPGDYYVRVVNNVTGASDRSDRSFTLVPRGTIKVDLKINGSDGPIIVPEGGATYTISWTSNAEECNIYSPRAVYPLRVPSSGSISMNLLATSEYPYPDRVFILCYSKKPVEGSANDYVELLPYNISLTVLSPNGGETIDFNSYYKITWKAPTNLTKVSIALYRNDAFYAWIVKDLPTMDALSGSYNWLPSNTVISDNDFGKNIFKIYILGYKSDGGTVEDKSDAPFTISKSLAPFIKILSPNGGEVWEIGKTYEIKWTNTTGKEVVIELVRSSTGFSTLLTSAGPTKTSFTWTIPSKIQPAQDYKIRIKTTDGTVVDTSDYPFSIVSSAPTSSGVKTPPCDGYGDVNLDGYVTQDDADLVLRYVVLLTNFTPEQIRRADVDGRDGVTAVDALLITRYVQGLTNSFGVCNF